MSPDEILSPREIEIDSAYAQGDTYQAIATRLGIAPSTVRTQLATIYRKLEVSSKLDLHVRLGGASPAADMATDHAAIISEPALSLEESIRREEALAEILRIISRSRGDIDAVMSAILGFALDLCEAELGRLLDHHPDGRFSAIFSRKLGVARSFVAIPMMSGDRLAGAFTIYRQTVRPFGALAIALARTFADQSVIALDNARMIGALRGKATPA